MTGPRASSRVALLAALCLLAPTPASADEGWQYRISGGGEINSDPHGVFDLGFRKGPLSLQLLTDTLDVRLAPEWSRGKLWIAARGEALFAGLLTSPWRDGAPDPASALFASYGGIDGGGQLFLRHLYLGVAASERLYLFSARSAATTAAVPGPTSLFGADAMIGHWEPAWNAELRVGVDVEGSRPEPRATLFAALHPPRGDGPLAALPLFELRAGWARDQGPLTLTRLGGLNPYVVPLAGAAWAEFRVQNYAAARLGMTLSSTHVDGGLLVDAAAFEGRIEAGFAALVRGRLGRWFAEATVGWAPWLARQPGHPAVSGFVLLGTGWGPVRTPPRPAAAPPGTP